MKRISTANRQLDKFGVGKDGFRAAVPGVSSATYLSADFFDGVQESLVRVIELAGLVPAADNDQMVSALKILLSYKASGIGAIPRQFSDKHLDAVSVFDYMTEAQIADVRSGLATLDVTASIQAAFNAERRVALPAGKYKCTSSITIPKNTLVYGHGTSVSTLQFTNAGDGLTNISPVNGNADASIHLRDFGLVCTNGANAGGGVVQVCGSYFNLERVLVQGFKYGVIFDQTEISSIRDCIIQFNTYGGIWLVNGAGHSVGANTLFTNRIVIRNNQLNSNPNQIIDDGGVAHTIEDNNINGGLIGIRVAGALAVSVANNEIEYCQTSCIATATTTLAAGNGVGQCYEVLVRSNFLIAYNARAAIGLNGGANCMMSGNEIQSPGGAAAIFAITGASSCPNLVSQNNRQVGFLGMLDSFPTNFWQWDDTAQSASYMTYYSPSRTSGALAVYCPSNFGGSSPVGGIDFQAYNLANTKATFARIAPGLTDNTTGAEVGAVVLQLAMAGTLTSAYTFKSTEFFANIDNSVSSGRSTARWSVIYSATGTINTSDAREKQQGRPIADAEKAVAVRIKSGLKAFKFNDAVAKKGDAARWHFGVYAQEVAVAFTEEGLDPARYALFCYDEWPAQDEVTDEDGTVVQPAQPAGNRYGIRYEELFAFILAGL